MSRREESESNALGMYLREIAVQPRLDREAEVELARRIRSGDSAALETLVGGNLRYVVAMARRFEGHGVPLSDLVTEGNLGLLRAARKFDETRGVRFVSYAAWWVRQSILAALSEGARIVRYPSGRIDTAQRITRVARRLAQSLGREPRIEEIAEEVGMTPQEVADALTARAGYVSLDAAVAGHAASTLLDLVQDPGGVDLDEKADREALREAIEDGLTRIPEREADIVRRYYGLGAEPPQTLEEIAGHVGLSRERVRAIKDRALMRLRLGESGDRLDTFRSD
ncbi:MAG: RNA polymerase sigma factor RpoD/SigA [Gemmatimonadota bacterium]|nr:RNA polymerase sigma factor RpoD/SigA [Gemmatimonadota bacterium]